MKIFITGSDGQLGKALQKVLKNKHKLFLGTQENCDITNCQQVIKVVRGFKPEIIIHAAAYTDVDSCETNKKLAFNVNAEGTKNVASGAKNVGAKLVYISTDFVFDGKNKKPYLETDEPNPLSVYGRSKLAGEEWTKKLSSKYFILRTAWLYGKEGKNFVKTMLSLAKEKDEVKVVNDQIGTPTYAADLVAVIEKIIKTDIYGLYHASNNGECSWYDFACEIFKLAGKKVKVIPITTEEFGRPAPRPAYSVLRNFCLEQQSIFMRNWQEALKEYIK
jgi:dTDP-4-dehydrorhamnose reductase